MSVPKQQSERLRHRLTILMLLAILPGLALAIYTGFEERASRREQAREQVRLLSKLAAADQAQLVESTRQVLEPLANLPLIHVTNAAFWVANFRNLLKLQPQYINFGLLETNGKVFASAVTPKGSPNYAARAFFANVIKTGQFANGGLDDAFMTNGPTLTFGYPVRSEKGVLDRVLFATVERDLFQKLAAKSPMPDQSTLLIFDAQGHILGQVPAPKRGEPFTPSATLFRAIATLFQGTLELSDAGSTERLFAFAAVKHQAGGPALFVAVGLPIGLIYAAPNRALLRNLLLLLLFAVAVIGVCHIYAHRYVVAPLNLLTKATEQLAAGDLGARTGIREGVELYPLARAFDQMAETMQALVSKLERANARLGAAEAKYRRVVEQSLVGIYLIQDGRFVYVNPKMTDIFGFSEQELLARPVLDFVAAEDRERVGENLRRRMGGEIDSLRYELRVRRRDGQVIAVEAHGGRFEHQGRPAVLGLLLDITARIQAETEIRRMNAELEQRVRERTAELEAANRELEAFSYSVSHDLRSPLRGMDGWSQALVEDYGDKLDAQAREYLGRVCAEAQRMGRLIDDLLELSRVTRTEMCREWVDLSRMARSVLDNLRAREPDRNVEATVAADLTTIGDPPLLRLVLENLIGNAWKYTGKRAQARIDFGLRPAPCTVPSGEGAHPETEFAFFVADNGAGFDMAHSAKLFAPFQRLHRMSEFPGTGVGLATVQRIIRRHGGRVWAEAAPQQGATFYFTLPRESGR